MSNIINVSEKWIRLNEEWESSELTQSDFCEQKEIIPAQFAYQRSKILKNRIYEKAIEFAPITLSSSTAIEEANAEVTIELPSQIKLRIPATKLVLSLVLNVLREQP